MSLNYKFDRNTMRYIIYLRQKNKSVFSLKQTKTLERTETMSKGIPLAGSGDRGDTKFEKANDSEKQINYYVGEKDDQKNKCHMYNEHGEDGKSGVVHRGGCAVCDDQKNNNSYSKIGDSEPSNSNDSSSSDGNSEDTGNSGGK